MAEDEAKKDRPVAAEDLVITTKDGLPVEIPEQGSLALLALGYKGLMAWRAKREIEQQGTAAEKP